MITAVKGFNDVRPAAADPFLDSAVWDLVLAGAAEVLNGYGYRQVLLPAVEETGLFARGIGEDTDIVSKEMYSFTDRGERSLTLRPEGTAGAVRAYVEHNLGKTDPVQRWWYFGPMFRAERPQKGRYRQFYQIGCELFGAPAPTADAELLLMLVRLCARLGLEGVAVRVNSLGDKDSRAAYRAVLAGYLGGQLGALCESCQKRVATNPLRVLDCKRPTCKQVAAAAPDIFDSLSPASRAHFDEVRRLLDAAAVPFARDSRLVRGLDYYTGTIFEFTTGALGAQDAILGGGRYDDLVSELGGPPTPAIGFAAGVERLALLVTQKVTTPATLGGPHLYVAPLPGTEARALTLADELRPLGPWRVEVDVSGGKLKQQMKRADRAGASFALVLGQDELSSGRAKLKNMRSDLQAADSLAMVELNGKSMDEALRQLGVGSLGARG